MEAVLAKATLSSPQNMEGCATTKELRKLSNKYRRIQHCKELQKLSREDYGPEIERLQNIIEKDAAEEEELKQHIEELERAVKK